jgi:DNA modification methylase
MDSERWTLVHGDSIVHMNDMPPAFVDFCVHSPPFPAVYAYSDSEADLGNSEDRAEMKIHLSYYLRALRRVMKPGRVAVVHVMQIPRMKRSGGDGVFDFRGLMIRLAERAGFIFDYDWVVRKNPQSQAQRTKSRALQFAGLETDRSQSRGAMPDYLLKFRAPGQAASPVCGKGEVSRNEWIEWAEPCWGGIRENDTLNGQKGKEAARGDGDTKHIAPLQLSIVDRLVRLYSDPGELVFTPFAGIGTELVVALKRGRRAYGVELKKEYYETARRNCAAAERQAAQDSRTLFEGLEAAP